MTTPLDVVSFWRAATIDKWFAKDAEFDGACRGQFLPLHMEVAARQHDEWLTTAEGALGLILLVDQIPRNVFRGTGHMYATDSLARHYARSARAAGFMRQAELELRVFFLLPFAHSESLVDQDMSVAMSTSMGQPYVRHAERHRDIIRRFGRFPHRNPILGRETTPQEAAFLKAGGFAG